jgi:hypothetical protein
MVTIRDQILLYLADHSEGVDDDSLAQALNLRQRQQANSRCRRLAEEGLVRRVLVNGRILNFPVRGAVVSRPQAISDTFDNDQPWSWEGNVQAAVVKQLQRDGYVILFAADTASRQQGKDIEAEKDGAPLWVTVKGYPKGTARTQPQTQARHWFKQAIFDVIVWHGMGSGARLGLALPDYPLYRKMAAKVSWLQEATRFTTFWVAQGDTVQVEEAGRRDPLRSSRLRGSFR